MRLIIFEFLKNHGTDEVIKAIIMSLFARLVCWSLRIGVAFELFVEAAEILLHECLFLF